MTEPATDAGNTRPAAEGIDDDELVQQVGEQTDSNLEVEGAFQREADGAASETEAAKATADELH